MHFIGNRISCLNTGSLNTRPFPLHAGDTSPWRRLFLKFALLILKEEIAVPTTLHVQSMWLGCQNQSRLKVTIDANLKMARKQATTMGRSAATVAGVFSTATELTSIPPRSLRVSSADLEGARDHRSDCVSSETTANVSPFHCLQDK